MDSEQLKLLIDRCKAGHAEAFDQIIALYSKRCFGFFYRLSGHRQTAEDLLSELFVKLVEKIGLWDGGSFDKWIFTIAGNLFKDHLRSRYRQKRLLEEKAGQLRLQEETFEKKNDLEDKLQQALSRLEPEIAELIMMRFYADFSFRELAKMRNEPIGTTLCKMHRGLKKLREIMEIPEKQRPI
jgi:RNA polymerase sigma-70 factor (ECF subfamily)